MLLFRPRYSPWSGYSSRPPHCLFSTVHACTGFVIRPSRRSGLLCYLRVSLFSSTSTSNYLCSLTPLQFRLIIFYWLLCFLNLLKFSSESKRHELSAAYTTLLVFLLVLTVEQHSLFHMLTKWGGHSLLHLPSSPSSWLMTSQTASVLLSCLWKGKEGRSCGAYEINVGSLRASASKKHTNGA